MLTAVGIAITEYLRDGSQVPEVPVQQEEYEPLAPFFVEELRRIYPDYGEAVSDGRRGVYRVLSTAGRKIGYLYVETVAVTGNRPMGYAGPVEVAVLTDPENIVSGVLLGKHSETRGFIRRLVKAGFLKRWNGIKLKSVSERDIEAVTGATMSSNAIKEGVDRLSRFYSEEEAGI